MKPTLALGLLALALVVLGCVSWKSAAPTVSFFDRNLVGEQFTALPDSDAQYQKEATNSAQVDNIKGLEEMVSNLLEAGVDPATLLQAANGDPASVKAIADNENLSPAEIREAQRMLATVALTKGLVNINNNSAGVERNISADVTAAITEALRAAVTASQRESTATENQPNASGGPSIPVSVTPIP